MPRKPRNSPNPPGRPPKVAEVAAAADLAERTGMPKGDAARLAGVDPSTVRKARRRAGKGAPAARRVPGRVSGGSAATGAPTGQPRARTGASPIDRLRAYAAADPEALAALEALLLPPEEGLGRDELAALRDGLVLAAGLVREAADARTGEDDDGRLLRALQRLEGLGKTVATVKAKRPPTDGPDEVTRRLIEIRDRAVKRMGLLVHEASSGAGV